jgi:hypothetical protein
MKKIEDRYDIPGKLPKRQITGNWMIWKFSNPIAFVHIPSEFYCRINLNFHIDHKQPQAQKVDSQSMLEMAALWLVRI